MTQAPLRPDPKENVSEVLRRHPRGDFKRELTALVRAEPRATSANQGSRSMVSGVMPWSRSSNFFMRWDKVFGRASMTRT
jgi:hypothetical protein